MIFFFFLSLEFMRHRQPLQELLKHIIGERKYFWKIKLSKYTTCTKKTRQIWVNSTLNPGLQQCQLFSEFSKVDYTFAACFFQQMSCVPKDYCAWSSIRWMWLKVRYRTNFQLTPNSKQWQQGIQEEIPDYLQNNSGPRVLRSAGGLCY